MTGTGNELGEYAGAGQVELVTEIQEGDVLDMADLLTQLTSKSPTPAELSGYLNEIVASTNAQMFVIRDENAHIIATTTANICRIPTGQKPWIDDVVTDSAHRGKGYARQLMETAHDWFCERGVNTSNLTSNPSRMAAGNLYESMGYEERDTRVYRAHLVAGETAVAKATS